jgi:phosphoglycolate phosphatase-like HAD superfamily hydrolase
VLLWDIDGTLLHGGKAAIAAWRLATQAEFGRDFDWRRVDASGATDISIAGQICAQLGWSTEAGTRLMARYVEELPEQLHCQPAVALTNAAEVLSYVADNPAYANLLLTGNLRVAAYAKLASCGLGQFLWNGAFGDSKLERNQVAAIARCLASKAFGSNVPLLVIGDTPRDIMAARSIGAYVLAVATGFYSLEALAKYHPDGLLAGLPPAEHFSTIIEKSLVICSRI